ncbi:hypothetical protein CHUAL_013785 [Chamberlinius hualienensis]
MKPGPSDGEPGEKRRRRNNTPEEPEVPIQIVIEALRNLDTVGIDEQFQSLQLFSSLKLYTGREKTVFHQYDGPVKVVRLLESGSIDVVNQAISVLNDAVVNDSYLKRFVANCIIVGETNWLFETEHKHLKLGFLRLLTKLFEVTPEENDHEYFIEYIELLNLCLNSSMDVVLCATNCLRNLSNGSLDLVEEIYTTIGISGLIKIIRMGDSHVSINALHMLANILKEPEISWDEPTLQFLLDEIAKLLKSEEPSDHAAAIKMLFILIKNETCFSAILKYSGLSELVMRGGAISSALEATTLLFSLLSRYTDDQIQNMVENGLLQYLYKCMAQLDVDLIETVLKILNELMSKAATTSGLVDHYACILTECRGIGRLRVLQYHQKTEIRNLARSLVREYFPSIRQNQPPSPSLPIAQTSPVIAKQPIIEVSPAEDGKTFVRLSSPLTPTKVNVQSSNPNAGLMLPPEARDLCQHLSLRLSSRANQMSPGKITPPQDDQIVPCFVHPVVPQQSDQNVDQKSGELTEQKSGESTEQKSGELTEQKSGESTEQKSGESTEQKSGELTEQKSGELTEQKSGELTEQKSGELTEQKSGELTEQKSGELTEQKSGELTEQKSGELTEQKSGELTEQKSGELTEQKSGELTEQKSGELTEQKSGESTGQKSGESTGQKSGESTDQKPGESTDQKPGESTDQKPGESTDQKPGESTDQKPGESTDQKPGESTDQKPGESTDQKPGESTDQKSGESTDQKAEPQDESDQN